MPGCAMRISNERGDKWVWLSFHGVAPASAEPEDLWGTPLAVGPGSGRTYRLLHGGP